MTKEARKVIKKYNGAAKPMKFKRVSRRSIIEICKSGRYTTNIPPERIICAVK